MSKLLYSLFLFGLNLSFDKINFPKKLEKFLDEAKTEICFSPFNVFLMSLLTNFIAFETF